MKLTVTKTLPFNENDNFMSIGFIGGSHDGEVFSQAKCLMSDGTERVLMVSSARPGYFKQVIVPFDFEDPAVVP